MISLGFILVVIPLVIAFVMNKSRQETKTILGVYFLIVGIIIVVVFSMLGLM